MKHILSTTFLFFSVIYHVQAQRVGRGNQPNQNRQPRATTERNQPKANELAGILFYDAKEVLKKAKVKDAVLKIKVADAVKKYNTKIKEISFLNADKLRGINVILKSIRADLSNGNQNGNRGNLRKKIGEAIRPIRKEVREKEVVLDETLKELLSEKQYKKWLKYQKYEKDKFRPKRPNTNENQRKQQRQIRNGNGARRGF